MLFFKQCPVSYNTPYEKIGDEVRSLADEVPFDIPDSREWVRLGNISSYAETKQKVNATSADPSIWGLDLEDIEKGGRLLEYKTVGERKAVGDKTIFTKGDILYSKLRPYLLKILVAPDDGICTPEIVPFRVYGGIDPSYIVNYLKSPYVDNLINSITYGVKMPRVGTETMTSLLVPIPPLEEQRRIVEKIDEVASAVSAYDVAYQKSEALNSTFPEALKKSILQEAVQGKLVPQDPSDEPAEALLEHIRAEKQRLVKEGEIKKDKHESVIFRRDNSHYEKRGSKEENINDIIPFELPDSWEWIRLSAILTSTDAGKSPQCENRPRTIGEWGVIKTTAIQDGYFLAEENKVLPLDFNLQESMVVHHGDLLITRAGPRNRTGVICVVDGEPENLILSDKTVRLSYLRNFVNPHYVMTALSSPAMQYFVVDAMTGMASSQVNISQEKMKTFLLPLPPLNEQQRIVDEVSKIFGRIDKLNF